MTDPENKVFLQLCTAKRLIDAAMAKNIYRRSKETGRASADILVEMGVITAHTVKALQPEVERAMSPKAIGGFRIVRPLGQGGMGTVYLAEQLSLKREVALKIIAPHIAADHDAAERFLREARIAGKLNNPNIVSIIDVGQDQGTLYMALEFVGGGDAARLAERFNGILPQARALEILIDCCNGLQALFEARLIHRDLKPANIFITTDGVAKLADLGLARGEQGDDRMTVTGFAVGTPAYMSPEQAGGEATLDIRSDIYSLGATLFTLVTGRKPFEGNGPFAIAAKVLTQTVPDPRSVNPQVAPAVAELIQRAMAKAPDERFQTPLALRTQALAVLDSLGQRSASTSSHRAAGPAGAISGVTPTTGPTTIPTQKLRTALKRLRSSAASESAWPRILLSALVVVVAAGFGWMVLTHGMAATAAPREHVRTPPSAPPLIAAPPAPVAPPAAKPVPPSPPAEPASPVPPPIAAWPAPPNAVAPAARWAQGHGTDAYGSWADLAIGSQIQRFRWIPPGSFTYGSPKSEVGHEEMWEKQRPVTFSRGFWLADSPCTQAVYQELTGLTPARYRGDAQLPVTNVSMADAEACAGALARRYPGTVFRLPTRCEWQYACRAGTTTVYFFGDDPHGIVAYGQVADPSTWPVPGMPEAPRGPRSDEHPVPVRHFKPNPWGLYDMLGNVCVWCYGRFKLPDGALVDPEADDVADERMGHIRGGNYWSSPKSFRAAEGGYISPEGRNDDIGFRLVILGDVPSPAGAKDVAPGH